MKAYVIALAIVLFGCGHAEAQPSATEAEGDTEVTASSAMSEVDAGPTTACATPESCPLQTWMKRNAARALVTRDAKSLERSFARIGTLDPGGFPRWRSIADAGRVAAASGDIETARTQCKACHDAYRSTYRETQRSAPLR